MMTGQTNSFAARDDCRAGFDPLASDVLGLRSEVRAILRET
jgi:hypothetical protein